MSDDSSLAVGEQHIYGDLFDAFSVGIYIRKLPSDARWAILFVAVGD
ncbi:MAG: hypothetical protein JST84_12815 [Acidobacteria bacterium]|nr:hypothetical protein [Acidobacteriota bacterium]